MDSTNSYLSQRLNSSGPFGAVYTQNQTAGKGRLGRSWETAAGLGLALSLALPRFDGIASDGLYPLIVGHVLLKFIHKEGLAAAEIKWPNDILVGGRKLAGVLCETGEQNLVIAGIGVNVAHSSGQLPNEHSTSLVHEGIEKPDVRDFVQRLVNTFRNEWRDAEKTQASWMSVLTPSIGTLGRSVKVFEQEGYSWEGIATGLDHQGHLLVRTLDENTLRTVVAADIVHLRQ